MNISLPNAWNGLDFATYKCDNHYISNVWGEVFELGIKIGGGSANGIVKNNHLVINCLVRNDTEDWRRKWEYIVKHKISFEVGNSTNELLIGNLAYNAYVGYSIINGAKGFNIIGNGTDSSGKYGIYVSGNVDGYIVNPLLVTMGTKLWCHSDGVCFDSGMNPSERQYIMTDSSFKGGLTIVNPLAWGNQEATAYDLNGTGDIHIYGGSIDAAKSTVIKNSNSSLAIIGLLIEVKDGTIIEYRNGAKNSILMGNICKNRNCSSAIANNGKTNLGINENAIR